MCNTTNVCILRYHWVGMTCNQPCSGAHSTLSTLYSMAKFAGLRDPVTLDFEGSTAAYCVDAFSISMGALLGTSPVTAFIESATGISGAFLPCFADNCSLNVIRGGKDRNYSHRRWPRLFCFCLLCPHIRFYSTLGDWRSLGHRRISHDSKVSVGLGLLTVVLTPSSVRSINFDVSVPPRSIASTY